LFLSLRGGLLGFGLFGRVLRTDTEQELVERVGWAYLGFSVSFEGSGWSNSGHRGSVLVMEWNGMQLLLCIHRGVFANHNQSM